MHASYSLCSYHNNFITKRPTVRLVSDSFRLSAFILHFYFFIVCRKSGSVCYKFIHHHHRQEKGFSVKMWKLHLTVAMISQRANQCQPKCSDACCCVASYAVCLPPPHNHHVLFCLLLEGREKLQCCQAEGEDGLRGGFATDLIINHLFN